MKHERRETLSWAPSGVRPFWSWLPPQLEGDFMVKEKASWARWIFRKGAGRGWALSWGGRPARDGALGWGPRSFEKVPEETVEGSLPGPVSRSRSGEVDQVGTCQWLPTCWEMTSCSMFAPARPPTPRPEKPEEVTVSGRVAPIDSKAGAAATALPWVRRKLRQ